MKRTKELKRSGFKRKAPDSDQSQAKPRTPLRRRGRLKPRSDKMAARYDGPDGRRAFRERVLAERPQCQAGGPIGSLTMGWRRGDGSIVWIRCSGVSVDVHEILARSAGGSILDETNVLAVCRNCHTWIGDHPKEALALGLRRSRYAGRNPEPT